MKKKEGIILGIGFWGGMGLMSLINFTGSIIFIPNYYDARYGLVMFVISIIFVIIGIVYLNKTNKKLNSKK